MPAPRRSPLHALHLELGAQLTEFAGHEMPLRYGSIREEHLAVRSAAGLFDVSHMGNLWLRGPKAAEALALATTADPTRIPEGGTRYAMVLRDDGTILDDLYLFRTPEGFHLVPNAGMHEAVARWLRDRAKAEVEDLTLRTCILALQGPRAQGILAPLAGPSVAALRPFRCALAEVADVRMLVSRTGYTGEDGFELFPPAEHGERVFRALLDAGRGHGLRPCGLGARDTLRLEMGFCLAGHEFAAGRTPLEAGLERFVAWEHEFVGKAALLAQRARGDHERRVGLLMEDKAIPRQGCEVRARGEARSVGEVTSGTLSPTLRRGIALAYVEPGSAEAGTALDVVVRGTPSPARVAEFPFIGPRR